MPTTPTAEIINESAKAIAAMLDDPNPPKPVVTVETRPRLGDIYTAIDGAPLEWIPSILARVVSIGLKSGAWSSVDGLVLSVQGFAKRAAVKK